MLLLKIKTDTNIPGKEPFILTKQHFQFQGNGENSDYASPSMISTSNYPYFSYIRYDASKMKFDTFFNKLLFQQATTTAGQREEVPLSDTEKHQNAVHNIMVMFSVFFPSTFFSQNNYHNSFDEIINGNSAAEVVTEKYDILPEFISRIFSGKGKGRASAEDGDNQSVHLMIDSSNYYVVSVTFDEDVTQNAKYRGLVRKIVEFSKWLDKEKRSLENKNKQNQTKLEGLALHYTIEPKQRVVIDKELKQIVEYLKRNNAIDTYLEGMINAFHQLYEALDAPVRDTNKILKTIKEIQDADIRYKNNQQLFAKSSWHSRTVPSIIPQSLTIIHSSSSPSFDDFVSLYSEVESNEDILNYLNNPVKYIALLAKRKPSHKEDKIQKRLEYFTQFIAFVRSFTTPNRSASNKRLQKIIDDSLHIFAPKPLDKSADSDGSDNSERFNRLLKYGAFVQSLRKDGKTSEDLAQIFDDDDLEIGVVMVRTAKDKSNRETEEAVEIEIDLQLIEGMVTPDILKEIKCIYKDSHLLELYSTLKNPLSVNKYDVRKKTKLIHIRDLVKQSKEASMKGEGDKVVGDKEEKNALSPMEGGKKSRTVYRRKNKKTRKIRR